MLSAQVSTEQVSVESPLPPNARPWPFIPVVSLFTTRVTAVGDLPSSDVDMPVINVAFDYGGTRVRLNDVTDRVLRQSDRGLEAVPRERAREHEACRLLERLGAVDLGCVDDFVTVEEADYAIHPFGSRTDRCAFTAALGAELRDRGFVFEVAQSYPYQLAKSDDLTWDVAVMPSADLPDWFSLELGVVIEGRRVDMLAVLLDLVDAAGEEEDLKALSRRLVGSVALPVSSTHNVCIPVERFRSLTRVLMELYQGVGNGKRKQPKIQFPIQRAPAIARMIDFASGLPGRVRVRESGDVVRRGRAMLEERPDIAEPKGLCATLRPYQRAGVAFLQHLRNIEMGGVLADDMGLGKTLQTIAHLLIEKNAGRLACPALVVAPTSLAFNWVREMEKFAPDLVVSLLVGPRRHRELARLSSNDVVVTTYPVLVRDVDKLEPVVFSSIILDEAQAIKNPGSQTHKALMRLHSEHRVCLSGTPVENDLGELWSLFDFVEPALLGSESSFRNSFRVPIETRGDESRLEALRDLVAPHVLRRTKREVVPELPPKTELQRPVELQGKQRELYEQIRVAAHSDVRSAIRKKGLAASTLSILDAIMKLRQVCCDPRLVSLDEARGVQTSAKYDAFFDLVETELPLGRRMLVFSQFTSMLALLAHGLRERDIGYTLLTGETRDRRAEVDRFERGEVPVFLISLKAGGTGLNLVSADTVVHYDPWWNPASQAQATDRAHRIGQTKPVFVHQLYAAGSVEERVLMLQKRKAWLAGALLGDPTQNAGSALTELDVERLLAPLEG